VSDETPPQSSLILYQTEDGRTRIECRFEDETVWLTQAQMAGLFQTTPQKVTLHLKSICAEAELPEAATCKEYLQVRPEGGREVTRKLQHYRLEAILAVGYGVRSHRGTQFRQWATARLPQRGCVSKPRVARNELPWDVGQTSHQPQRGCVTSSTPCLNPCPPSIFTLCSRPRIAGHFSTIPRSARKCTPTWRAHPSNSTVRPSSPAGSRTMYTCSPATDAALRRRIGSRNSNVSPAFGSRRATPRYTILPGSLVTASFPSAHRMWMPCATMWPVRRHTIGSPRFKTSSGRSCGNTEWNGTNDTCGIKTITTVAAMLGGVTQPRWGWGRIATMTQGSAGRATLGWRTESLWDSQAEVPA